jgi:hypothetical protein
MAAHLVACRVVLSSTELVSMIQRADTKMKEKSIYLKKKVIIDNYKKKEIIY